MKVELFSEYYDGLIQGVLSDDGSVFYALCIRVDFPDISQDRVYWVAPIDDAENQRLRQCLEQSKKAFDALLRATFLHRNGMVLKGEPESWSGKDLRFESRGDAHAMFLRYPSLDVLARVSARHASSASKKGDGGD